MNVFFGPASPYRHLVQLAAEQPEEDLAEDNMPCMAIAIKWVKLLKRYALQRAGYVRHYHGVSFRWIHSILVERSTIQVQNIGPRLYAPDVTDDGI